MNSILFLLGFLSPANRGALMTCALVLYVCLGTPAGYVAARYPFFLLYIFCVFFVVFIVYQVHSLTPHWEYTTYCYSTVHYIFLLY
jgi:hypothetical protein